jgi:hypothetical protein
LKKKSAMAWDTLREIFEPKNVFMSLLNVLIFVLVQIAFTIANAQATQRDIFIAKAKPIEVVLKESTENERKRFCEQKPAMTQAEIDAKSESITAESILLAKEMFMYPILAICAIMAICAVRIRFRFNLMDLFVVFVIFAAFSTELFYFYVIVKNFEFLSPLQLLQEYFKPGSAREVASVGVKYNQYYLNGDNNLYYTCGDERCDKSSNYCACGKCVVSEYCREGKQCFLVSRDINNMVCKVSQLPVPPVPPVPPAPPVSPGI